MISFSLKNTRPCLAYSINCIKLLLSQFYCTCKLFLLFSFIPLILQLLLLIMLCSTMFILIYHIIWYNSPPLLTFWIRIPQIIKKIHPKVKESIILTHPSRMSLASWSSCVNTTFPLYEISISWLILSSIMLMSIATSFQNFDLCSNFLKLYLYIFPFENIWL